jgi:hypothetical protein
MLGLTWMTFLMGYMPVFNSRPSPLMMPCRGAGTQANIDNT